MNEDDQYADELGAEERAAIPTPSPVTVQICGLCAQPWEGHTRRAWADALAQQDPEDEDALPWARPVHAGDCVALLKIANAGPIGHTGPPGAAGKDAQLTWDRALFERDIRSAVEKYLTDTRAPGTGA